MIHHHPLQMRLPEWSDWLSLVFMSFAAPITAAFIHSAWVFHRGIRLYNAEIGGAYFHGAGPVPPFNALSVLACVSGLAIPAIPTFLVLLSARKRASLRWIIWAGSVALWTFMFFKTEVAFH